MPVDQYGRSVDAYGRVLGVPNTAWNAPGNAIQMNGYGAPPNAMPYGEEAPAPQRQAVIQMPFAAQMGGQQPVPWVRYPYYPTAPFYSTDPNVGYQTRYYSTNLVSTDADYQVNAEAIRNIQFDIPARLIAINGACFNMSAGAGNALPVGVGPRDPWLFRLEYTNGDRLMINARIASTVLGTAEQPGELGGTGWTIDQGAAVTIGLTPLLANLRIDITLVCLEMRGPRNFSQR